MHASAGRINLSLYILCLLMCRGGCNGYADGFRQQRPRWGILPIRQFADTCPRWDHWEPCICWESGCDVWTLVSATHSFSHAKILTVLVMLHVDVVFDQLSCTCSIMMLLADIGCVVLVTLSTCFCTISNANIANICGGCNSNDGFREQRPRWGILPIRQFAHACPCWYSWHYWHTLDNKHGGEARDLK